MLYHVKIISYKYHIILIYYELLNVYKKIEVLNLNGNDLTQFQKGLIKKHDTMLNFYYERDKYKIHNPKALRFSKKILDFLNEEADMWVYRDKNFYYIGRYNVGKSRYNLIRNTIENQYPEGRTLCPLSKYLKDKEIPEDWNIYDINLDLNFRYR